MTLLKDKLQSWYDIFVRGLPDFVMALIVLLLGIFIIRTLRNRVLKRILARSKDPVASRFIADFIAMALYIILFIICLNIIGLNTLTATIMGAAGLTTFIIGFALKDIGENFLAGILMVFNRPFKMGDIIQVDNETGRVISISLRETIIKSLDGKDIYIPNADILKKPLINFTLDDLLRSEFEIVVFNANDIQKVISLIEGIVVSFPEVLGSPASAVNIGNFNHGMVTLTVRFWYSLNGTRTLNAKLRTNIMLAVLEKLKETGIQFPDHIQDLKIMKVPGVI